MTDKEKALRKAIKAILDKYFGSDHFPLTIDKAKDEILYEVKIRTVI